MADSPYASPAGSSATPTPYAQKANRLQNKLQRATNKQTRFDNRHPDVNFQGANLDFTNPYDQRVNHLSNRLDAVKTKQWGASNDALYNPQPDQQYTDEMAAAQKKDQNANVGIGAQQGLTQLEYGLNAAGQIDSAVTNPYSRASQLQSAYQQQFSRTGNSYAAAGQLYSGALDNARASDASGFDQGLNQMQGDFGKLIAGYNTDRTTAADTLQADQQAASSSWLDRAQALLPDTAPPTPKYVKRTKNRLQDEITQLQKGKENRHQRQKIQKLKKQLKVTDPYTG